MAYRSAMPGAGLFGGASRARADIQGLRAIAVGGVVLFHVRPGWFPGGFVGVDVFFVISGFLITGSLLREAATSGTVQVLKFWARRIRRLMPAATTVLVATVIAARLLLPVTQWASVANEAVASALSAQNWVLAAKSVAYLHVTTAPSPLQHFWSLSVEEQFYFAWPFLVAAVFAGARKLRLDPIASLRVASLVPLVLSLGYSVSATKSTPDAAYFSTFTRSWELLLGAAVALWLPVIKPPVWASRLALSLGAVAIVVSMWSLGGDTAFPGYAALLPTVGAACVIAGGAGAGPCWVRSVLEWRPMTYVGDLSYSLYLWHWPAIVIVGAVLGTPALPAWAVLAVVVGSTSLAALSKPFIEDRFMHPRPVLRPAGSTSLMRVRSSAYALGAVLLVATGTSAAALRLSQSTVVAHETALVQSQHPGARFLDPAFEPASFPGGAVEPAPSLLALQDIERQLREPCLAPAPGLEVSSCTAGDPDGDHVVLIAGDSHAAEWLPALDELGRDQHWRVVLAAKQSCPLMSPDTPQEEGGPVYGECLRWNIDIRPFIEHLRPEIVFTSAAFYTYPSRVGDGDAGYDLAMAQSYAEQYAYIADQGATVVAMVETPFFPGFSPPTCLFESHATVAECGRRMTRAMVERTSRIELAASLDDRVQLVDVSDLICHAEGCDAVIGNVTTYRDDNHLTPEFARSLSWTIESVLRDAQPSLFSPSLG